MARTGAMMNGSNPDNERQANDFYPTPENVTQALLDNWPLPPKSTIWEPACGDGAISKVLEAAGHKVTSSDLNDMGHGTTGIDFLSGRLFAQGTTHIITNPPFKLAAEFIDHACSLEVEGVAMLLKSQFWHARKRTPLFHKHRPAMILPLTWRPDFLNQGGPTMDVMWCVWIKGWGLPTIYRPILRPDAPEIKVKKPAKKVKVVAKEFETA